ncbi:hypothetical protein HDK90DRAFT_495727 [Phyllosticta capitalensis]|uniref:Uncharacterized protein n=1 Tax=Phyllosticta capitalensis TaxID=121624 RepID=A0ABR1YFR9_9PEZI
MSDLMLLPSLKCASGFATALPISLSWERLLVRKNEFKHYAFDKIRDGCRNYRHVAGLPYSRFKDKTSRLLVPRAFRGCAQNAQAREARAGRPMMGTDSPKPPTGNDRILVLSIHIASSFSSGQCSHPIDWV